jgi:hypothetical protein
MSIGKSFLAIVKRLDIVDKQDKSLSHVVLECTPLVLLSLQTEYR